MQIGSLDKEDPLEEEMAPHSNTLAWEIPWTEEPGGYSPWGFKKSQTRLSDSILALCDGPHPCLWSAFLSK